MQSRGEQADVAESDARDTTQEADSAKRSFLSLMEGMREGSEEAALEIVERYSDTLLLVIRRSLPNKIRDKVDSVDLLNTVLGSLLSNRELFQRVREPEQFVALLANCARNRVHDESRRYLCTARRDVARESPGLDQHENPAEGRPTAVAGDGRLGGRELTPSVIAAFREKWRSLRDGLNRREKRVLTLRLQGHSFDKIAEEMRGDVSASTAGRIIARIEELLRQ